MRRNRRSQVCVMAGGGIRLMNMYWAVFALAAVEILAGCALIGAAALLHPGL